PLFSASALSDFLPALSPQQSAQSSQAQQQQRDGAEEQQPWALSPEAEPPGTGPLSAKARAAGTKKPLTMAACFLDMVRFLSVSGLCVELSETSRWRAADPPTSQRRWRRSGAAR